METGTKICGMEWYGNQALFEIDGRWYVTGLVACKEPFTMHGFIEPAVTEWRTLEELRSALSADVEAAWRSEAEQAAAEEAVLRFYEEGWLLPEGWTNNYDDYLYILDGEKFPPMGPYSHMERNPKSPDEVVAFFSPDPDDEWDEDE